MEVWMWMDLSFPSSCCCSSSATGLQEDGEHGSKDEEAKGPQKVVQEDVDPCAVSFHHCWFPVVPVAPVMIHWNPGPVPLGCRWKHRCSVKGRGSQVCIGLNLVKEVKKGVDDLVSIGNNNYAWWVGCLWYCSGGGWSGGGGVGYCIAKAVFTKAGCFNVSFSCDAGLTLLCCFC